MKRILVGGAAIMMMFGAAVANAQTQGSPAAAQSKDAKSAMEKNMEKDGMSKDGMAKDGMSKGTTGSGMSDQTKTQGAGSANKK